MEVSGKGGELPHFLRNDLLDVKGYTNTSSRNTSSHCCFSQIYNQQLFVESGTRRIKCFHDDGEEQVKIRTVLVLHSDGAIPSSALTVGTSLILCLQPLSLSSSSSRSSSLLDACISLFFNIPLQRCIIM